MFISSPAKRKRLPVLPDSPCNRLRGYSTFDPPVEGPMPEFFFWLFYPFDKSINNNIRAKAAMLNKTPNMMLYILTLSIFFFEYFKNFHGVFVNHINMAEKMN